ncbi:hypothetical protein L1887_32370 [Cichorium endivia]|nr:hypothetical protein L1887_32370 [Cichorium endivia]
MNYWEQGVTALFLSFSLTRFGGESSANKSRKERKQEEEFSAKWNLDLDVEYDTKDHPIRARMRVGVEVEFVNVHKIEDANDEEIDYDDDESGEGFWILKVGFKIRDRLSVDMQLKMFGDQRRTNFIESAVWALKFMRDEDYREFH